MIQGSLLCWLVLLQVCIVQLPLISSRQLTGGQVGDNSLCQDPLWKPRLMSSHGRRDEVAGRTADSVFNDEDLIAEDTGDESASDDGGMLVDGGEFEAAAEEDEGFRPSDDGYDDKATGDVQCPECGKIFKNDKSMFGHLRSHPNRGYKGATPPMKTPDTPAASAFSSSLQGNDRSSARHSQRDPQLTPLEVLCAYILLSLKNRGNSHATHVLPPPPPPPLPGNIDSFALHEDAMHVKAASNLGCCNDERGDSIVKVTKKRRNIPKEAREVHRKKVKLVPAPKEKRLYICKHCKEEFPTHQALGGHMAGHHREKKVPALNNSLFKAHQGMASESMNVKQEVKGGDGDGDRWHNSGQSPRRGLLPQQFSMALDTPWQSGQTSGGKMRPHIERKNNGVSPAVVAPTPTLNDDGDDRRLLNIDLNVEASEQE